MKTVKRIDASVDHFVFGFWQQYSEGEGEGEFYPLKSVDDYREAAEYLECSEKLLDTLSVLFDSLLSALATDLKDIWQRLDSQDR